MVKPGMKVRPQALQSLRPDIKDLVQYLSINIDILLLQKRRMSTSFSKHFIEIILTKYSQKAVLWLYGNWDVG